MSTKSFKFSERDGEILLSLYKHRFLSISQVQRIHFPSLQTTYRRMKKLHEAGLVASFTVANIPESIFSVARKGMASVAALLGTDTDDLKWTDVKAKPKDYYFMQHFLAINDFRITITRACANSPIKLMGFIPDYFGEKTSQGGTKKYIKDVICDISNEREEVSHTPDGVFALEKDGKTALFFLEIDRGTEVVGNQQKGVLKSIRFYINYLLEGKFQRYAKDFNTDSFKGFRSIYITTSAARMENIRMATTTLKIADKAKRFHWISTFGQIDETTIFEPVWLSIDPHDTQHYKID